MKFSVLAIMGLGLTAQTAAPTPWATVSDRNVVAAAEIFLYRHSIAEHSPLYDVRVSMHAGTAYVFGYVDGGSRGALLRKTGSTWSVVGEAKGQFPPDVFSAEGVEPAIALMAVKSECPALSVPRKRMTPDQLLIAKNSYSATLPARAVKDIEDRSFTLPKISYRTCLNMKMSSQEVIETWANGEIIEMSSEQADSWREAVLDAVGSEPQNADPETFERDLLEFVREFYQITSRESDRAALVRFVEKATLSNDDVNRAIAAGILYSFRKTPENAQRLLSFIEDPAEFPYLRAWFYLHPGIAARDPAVIDGIQRLLSNPETTEEVRLETLRMLGCNRDLFS